MFSFFRYSFILVCCQIINNSVKRNRVCCRVINNFVKRNRVIISSAYIKMPAPIPQNVRGQILAYINAGLSATEVSRLCNVNVRYSQIYCKNNI